VVLAVSGKGVVAVIDTGVDVNHPALVPCCCLDTNFTRNQAGASEWTDVAGLPNGPIDQDSQDQQPVVVQHRLPQCWINRQQQSLMAARIVAFGHGTMTAGLVHLVAPKAKILPLKARSLRMHCVSLQHHCGALLRAATWSERS